MVSLVLCFPVPIDHQGELMGVDPPSGTPCMLASRRGALHNNRHSRDNYSHSHDNYRHSRVGGNPGGEANGDASSIWSCDSTDIELCKEPTEGRRGGAWVRLHVLCAVEVRLDHLKD